MEGTIIRNKPDYRYESIDKSATLRIAPGVEGTTLLNLTIENALDYYHDDNGRGVALWDQGTKTVCRNVRLLGHQDTYYSDREGAKKYFEACEIHGTVDFICGDGDVYFRNCLLYCERRSKSGEGTDALTASGAGKDDKGYVFEGCTIKSECPVVSLGRSWKNNPKCVFLNTVLDYSVGVFELRSKDINRWTTKGMMALPELFGEYNTMDAEGRVVSPEMNEVEFTLKGKTKRMNTILSPDEAARYTMEYVLGAWAQEAINKINNINKQQFNQP
jgi:pectin methylesterase-like acyl-CoA thioesterase